MVIRLPPHLFTNQASRRRPILKCYCVFDATGCPALLLCQHGGILSRTRTGPGAAEDSDLVPREAGETYWSAFRSGGGGLMELRLWRIRNARPIGKKSGDATVCTPAQVRIGPGLAIDDITTRQRQSLYPYNDGI